MCAKAHTGADSVDYCSAVLFSSLSKTMRYKEKNDFGERLKGFERRKQRAKYVASSEHAALLQESPG